MPEDCQLAMDLGGNGAHFVANAQVNRQVRAQAQVVLYVNGRDSLANSTRTDGTGECGRQGKRLVAQKIREGIKEKFASRRGNAKLIVPDALEAQAKLERVGPFCPGRVVVGLQRRPVKMEVSDGIQSAQEGSYPRDGDSRSVEAGHGAERRIGGGRVSGRKRQSRGGHDTVEPKPEGIE